MCPSSITDLTPRITATYAIVAMLVLGGCTLITAPDTGYVPSPAAQAASYPKLADVEVIEASLSASRTPYLEVVETNETLAARRDALEGRVARQN